MRHRVSQFNHTDANITLDRLFLETVFKNICFDFNLVPGKLSFTIVSDEKLLEINKEHLNHDYYTDIITFGQSINGMVMGEIFVSIDRIIENSKIFKVDYYHELSRLYIHGICHLCGQNDYSDIEREQMQLLEEKYLTLHFVSRGTI